MRLTERRAALASWLCRLLPPFAAYRLHHRFLGELIGSGYPFRVRALFGPAEIAGRMSDFEDVYFALHRTKNYKGMVVAATILRPGDTVMEIGANVGTETIPLANLTGSRGRVIAVEADPELCRIVSSRLEAAGLRNVTVVNRAVAAEEGTLHVVRGAANLCGQTYVSATPPEGGSVSVRATTADALVAEYGAPAFVFMDIEGSEYGFFAGASRLLSEVRPVIFSEIVSATLHRSGGSLAQLSGLLEAAGYAAYDTDTRALRELDLRRPPADVCSDWLLVPRERAGIVPAIRRRLLLARVMPKVRGLSPLGMRGPAS